MTEIELAPACHAENLLHHAVTSAYSHSDQEDLVPDNRFIGPFPRTGLQHFSVLTDAAPVNEGQIVDRNDINDWANQIKQCLARTVGDIVQVGTLLLAAKKALPHGGYVKMVKGNLPFNVRQAQNYTLIARNAVLSNAQNAAFLPRSVNQLSLIARLRDTDLIEIIADVKARLANGEQVNTDSPKLWTAYQEKYGQQALPKEGEKAAQESLSAGPDQADPPASEVPPHNPPDIEESQEENDSNHCEAEQSSESSDPEMDCAAKSDAHPPCDHESTVAKAAEGEKAMGDADITDKDDGKSEPEKQISPTMQAPASTEAAKCQAQQPAANDHSHVVDMTNRKSMKDEPSALTEEEKRSGEALYELWLQKIASEWCQHPKKVRIFMLKWLLEMEMKDDSQSKAA